MKPILFNTEMVRAILDGRKTQTRRVIKATFPEIGIQITEKYPYFKKKHAPYKLGDILWVRETFVIEGMRFNEDGTITHHEEPIVHYKADGEELTWFDEWEDEVNVPWKPSIHMNKELARIFLRVTNVRVERLQDITYADILKEGYKCSYPDIYNTGWMSHKATFYGDINNNEFKSMAEWFTDWWANLWNSTAKEGYKWEDNPYVFVYEFEKVEKPCD